MDMTANDAIQELERYFQQTYVECVDREVRPLSAIVIQYAIEAIRERSTGAFDAGDLTVADHMTKDAKGGLTMGEWISVKDKLPESNGTYNY